MGADFRFLKALAFTLLPFCLSFFSSFFSSLIKMLADSRCGFRLILRSSGSLLIGQQARQVLSPNSFDQVD